MEDVLGYMEDRMYLNSDEDPDPGVILEDKP